MPPLATIRDHLVIEYSRFVLQDEARLHNAGDLEPAGTAPWRMVAGPGGAIFHSESNDREIAITLEAWQGEPQALPEWPVVATGITRPGSSGVRLASVTAAMTPNVLRLVKAGPHHIRAALRTTTDHENVDEYESEIVEEWLIQLWPL